MDMARGKVDSIVHEDKPLKERMSGAAIDRRVKEAQRRHQHVEPEMERIAVEEAKLVSEGADGAPVSRQQRRAHKQQLAKLEARKLRLLERDDAAVLEILRRQRRIDSSLACFATVDSGCC